MNAIKSAGKQQSSFAMSVHKFTPQQLEYIRWIRWLRLTKKERKAIKKYRKEKDKKQELCNER